MEKSNINIKAIIGIGNPGSKYSLTYHNVGKIFIDYILKDRNGDIKTEKRKKFSYTKTENLIIAKTESFMNESGIPVKNILDYFELEDDDIMVVHDDSDITKGSYKISFGKSSAGHKGIESIISHIGENFWRCRIGIRPKNEVVRKKSEEFVLKKITISDMDTFENIFKEIKKEILK